jgi:hypothetical protein
MPRQRVAFIVVFALGLACGISIAHELLMPRPAVAQDRTRTVSPRTSTADLTARVTALEAKLAKLEQSVVVSSTGAVTIKGPQLRVTSAVLDVQSPLAKFSDMIQGKTLNVNSVISASYTPGAGNVW